MKIKDFKFHAINRSVIPKKGTYKDYRPFLKQDFQGRCAYCNLKDAAITTPFEIDHFIPRAVFEPVHMEMDTDYKNLMYACKKCNTAKGKQFEGDISLPNPTNQLFYDPTVTDYNTIFYRNELGAIASDDPKGRAMIQRLRLYSPIHILGWLCEELNIIADKLQKAAEIETDSSKKTALEDALHKVEGQFRKYINLFIASYNDSNFYLDTLSNED